MRFTSLWFLLFALLPFAAAQDTNFAQGPQYLTTTTSTSFIRPIATPTVSLDAPLPPIPDLPEIGPAVLNQPYVSDPVLAHQADLFPIYYGYPEIPVVELASTEESVVIPDSLNELGFAHATPQTLREFGYGVPLGDVASYWKTHKPQAPRVFTNSDIQRLHAK
jgi:hypothetical protein